MQLQDIQSRVAGIQRSVRGPSGQRKFIRGAALMLSLCLAAHGVATYAATRYVGDTSSDSACTDNDIQSAINHAGVGDTIVITAEHVYTDQALTLNNKSLTLTANGSTCGTAPPSTTTPFAILHGSNNGHSVLYITGTSNITLQNIEITDGCVGSTHVCGGGSAGGGIEFSGNGSLTLNTVTVLDNLADYGGGIDMSTSGGNASLILNADTLVQGNSVGNDGGGIRIVGTGDGQATLSMTQGSSIWDNSSSGYGGGINVVGNAIANIASAGLNEHAAIYDNLATYGGGIAVTANGDGYASAFIYSTDAANPTTIQNNQATKNGGGIYASSDSGGNYAAVYLWDYQLTGNSAAEGAAIYLDEENGNGSFAYSNITETYGDIPGSENFGYIGRPSGSVRCTPSLACNAISNNVNQDTSGNPTSGATIFLADSNFDAGVLQMRGNLGAYVLHGSLSIFQLFDCLLADNTTTKQLLDVDNLSVINCTIAHNSIGNGNMFYGGEEEFQFVDSIVDQPGVTTWAHGSSINAEQVNVHDVLSSEIASLPARANIVQGAPTYVNEAGGDYHLTANSRGVDFAPANGGTIFQNEDLTTFDNVDLDNNPRIVDLGDVSNSPDGPRDLGAYEVQNEVGFTGICGPDNGKLVGAEPTDPDVLCTAGSIGGPAATSTGWSWTCGSGINGSTVAQCSATQAEETLELSVSQVPTTGTIGLAYSGTVVFGNLGNVGFSPSATLTVIGQPDGLSLGTCNAGGVAPHTARTCTISGTPTTVGTFYATFTLIDPASSAQVTAIQTITIAQATPDLWVSVAGLPTSGTVGVAYTGTIHITNMGTAPSSASATASVIGLPPGLSLGTCDPSNLSNQGPMNFIDCTVSGTPTTVDTYTVTASVDLADSDPSNNTATATITIVTATTTTLNATPNPATAGQAVTFNVSVDPTGAPAPTGTVAISGGGQSCTATLTAISATTSAGDCALTFASAGAYTVTATYSGDTIYAASSTTLNLTVNAAAQGSPQPAPTLDRWAWFVLMSGLCGLAVFRRRRSNP